MRHESVITEFVEANGLRFEVDKCGSGDTLVMCLHGFPEHAISWRFQMPMLAEMGYTVWAPNQRGYGLSDKPKGVENYSTDKLAEDIGALFDASGCKDLILMGHDWGAGVAWTFALGQVRPLKRLIIANVPHPAAMRRELETNKDQKKKSWYIGFFQIPWLPEFLMRLGRAKVIVGAFRNTAVHKENFPDELMEVYRENAMGKGALTGMINWYRAAFGGGGLSGDTVEIPMIDVPTLMLWGEQDMALSKASTIGTEEWVSNLTLRYLSDASHWVQQDAPQAFNAALSAWLQDQPIPSAAPDSAITLK
jgi:pimeloyl-ACP methyl ester carboxylesterase